MIGSRNHNLLQDEITQPVESCKMMKDNSDR
jgi:hypothetical protein